MRKLYQEKESKSINPVDFQFRQFRQFSFSLQINYVLFKLIHFGCKKNHFCLFVYVLILKHIDADLHNLYNL